MSPSRPDTGITAFGAGQGAQAEKDFRAALIADPENVYAYYDLGVVAGTYDTVQAEYYYRIALGHDPTYTPALMNLSKLLADQGRTDEAIELLTGAPAGEPGAGGAWPAETVNGRVAARLEELLRRAQELGEDGGGGGGVGSAGGRSSPVAVEVPAPRKRRPKKPGKVPPKPAKVPSRRDAARPSRVG